MGDAKWVKIEVNMFDDTKLKIIDNMENRDSVHYFWTRVLVLAGKINRGGYLYITDNMPYTIKTIAIEFNRSVNEAKTAFKVLKRLEMIQITEDKAFKITNWDKHQNVEGLERIRNLNNERVAKYRAKKKESKANLTREEKGQASNFDEQVVNAKDNIIDDINKNEEIKAKENINCSYERSNDLGEINDNDNLDNSNSTENIKYNNTNDNCDFISNDKCNVTSNDNNSSGNITVMEQKKKEIKKKIKKKRESKSDIEINDEKINDEKDNSLISFSDSSDLGEIKENENLNNQAVANLLKHHQSMTGIIGGLNLGSLKLAISMHGYENVKMAINKALEVNKSNMTYINGILKNWRREGYPKEEEIKKNGVRSTRKNNSKDKNEFTGFKPKKPRNLTEAQRKGAEENLI
jgi:predicted phage replisome organizer